MRTICSHRNPGTWRLRRRHRLHLRRRSSRRRLPLPYVFVGSYNDGSQPTVYFLTRGDRVYDVHVGDTLDGIYSVDSVQNGALVFTYKPLNTQQTLELGGGT